MSEWFDYVVVGGGSAGSVLAGRLTEDPTISLCLLEAGGGGNGPLVNIPTGAVAMLPARMNNWALETVPQAGLNGRLGFQPRGKCLGGSSAINAMVYIRGHRSDYDDWAALGNAGWSYADVLPYFRLSEHNERINNQYHGQDGPLQVSDLRTHSSFHRYFLDAAREAGLPLNDDFNGAEQEGAGIYQVTQQNGERMSAARAFLLPHVERHNLEIKTLALAQRILFEGKRAVGIEYKQGEKQCIVRAKKEVILASGAFQTPQLLMLSGVGDRDELTQHGVPMVHHLPGVGKHLQDHPDFVFGMTTDNPDTFSFTASGFSRLGRESWRYYRQRQGALTSNFAEAGAFLRTRPQLERPDVQLHLVTGLVDNHGRTVHFKRGFSCHVCLLRPRSHGTVRLQSTDPQATPLIDPGFLKDPQDLEDLVAGFKLTQRLLDAPSLKQQIKEYVFPTSIKNDDDIRAVLRERVDTVYHPVGSCRMGIDGNAVVDPQLRVHGITGLRIADASIMPGLIGGNTNAPTMMIAEKAVDLISGRCRVPGQSTTIETERCEHHGIA